MSEKFKVYSTAEYGSDIDCLLSQMHLEGYALKSIVTDSEGVTAFVGGREQLSPSKKDKEPLLVNIAPMGKKGWQMLREQKQDLMDIWQHGSERSEDSLGSIPGLLHLIDAIQDSAVDDADIPHEEVFGILEES